MSLLENMSVTCPSCSGQFEILAADSVNADRRPDLRDEIIENTFQVVTCSKCDETFRLDPRFNYLDIDRGLFLASVESERVFDWVTEEQSVTEIVELYYGASAGAAAQEIGDTLSKRLVFGWPATREKIILNEAGLDDVTAELVKLVMIRGDNGIPIESGYDLRVFSANEAALEVVRLHGGTGEITADFDVPRTLYDTVHADADGWTELRQQLSSGPFVDLQRLYLDGQ